MFTPSSTRYRRSGFTLVEVLVTVGIIAILAGILVPAVFAAMGRAREAAITTETMQLAASIEQFKNDYGFYPPTFGVAITSAPDMLPYLNKISRNHAEGNGAAGTNLRIWWDNVGVNLDNRSGLVFWLSGLCKNSQLPLTGYARTLTPANCLAPYAVDEFSALDGAGDPVASLAVQRDVRYDFKKSQIDARQLAGLNIAIYNQAYGTTDGDRAYRYLDYRSYLGGGAYANAAATVSTPLVQNDFINPQSFQLVSPGMDGVLTAGEAPLTYDTVGPTHDDNIVNFTPGRFDVYVNNQ